MRLSMGSGLALALLSAVACSEEAATSSRPEAPASGAAAGSGAMNPDGMAGMGGMMTQRDPDPSRNFALNMIEHHQGAVTMSQSALPGELDPEMRSLAQKIIGDQEREIAQMKAFLNRAPVAR